MARIHTNVSQSGKQTDEGRNKEGSSILPPDGHLIYVSLWRRQVASACLAMFSLLYLSVGISAFAIGTLTGVTLGVVCLVMAVISVRATLSGLMLEDEGMRLRTPLRTYRWKWNEIERFDLRPRGYSPRFRIHLRDGRIRKVRGGFFAKQAKEEERLQALFEALAARLEAGQSAQTEASAN